MEKKFLVKTMTCHHCENAIKDTLSKLEGVKSIDVNLDDKIVTVNGDNLNAEKIKESIEDIGFDACDL